jgi:hypothetical protein
MNLLNVHEQKARTTSHPKRPRTLTRSPIQGFFRAKSLHRTRVSASGIFRPVRAVPEHGLLPVSVRIDPVPARGSRGHLEIAAVDRHHPMLWFGEVYYAAAREAY